MRSEIYGMLNKLGLNLFTFILIMHSLRRNDYIFGADFCGKYIHKVSGFTTWFELKYVEIYL